MIFYAQPYTILYKDYNDPYDLIMSLRNLCNTLYESYDRL